MFIINQNEVKLTKDILYYFFILFNKIRLYKSLMIVF